MTGKTARGRMGGLADMSPAYFGLVMATGIISLAANMVGYPWLAQGLFVLNCAQYAVLVVLYVLRAWHHPRRFFGDMVAHATGPGYFTAVAATGIMASQFMILREDILVGRVLWVVAVILWLLLTYTIFTAFTIRHDKPAFERGISGAWLLAVVATQSLSVTSALLAARVGQPLRLELNFLALSTWLFGGMLYIWMMALIFYRYTFFRFSPSDLSPPYWINMGAMAISTLAGSLLALEAPHAPYIDSLLPFIKGFTLFYWATGTWWIPMLLLLGVWRHGYERFPLRYDPLYWGAVFPLGMYTACTWQLDRAMGFGFLSGLAWGFFHVSAIAWAMAFLGLTRRLWIILRQRGTTGELSH
ncbi:MAG: tellurite resistance/C4-dicarboxylate transporter family protein [Rubellimicrobium sp.]|nr:tellurite resistance/C4-dicarboxylate transporter family protein [Rubellimicrobium sp.]